jgi:hypothetical protein
MKFPLLPLAVICATALSSGGLLKAESSPVLLRVEQVNTSDMGAKDKYTRKHARTLNVFVTNNSSDTLDLKVKYIVFGRDMLHHDYTTVGQGEKPVTVKPHIEERVTTTQAASTSVQQHYDAKTKKKIDPSGATIMGAGVQVLQGDKLMAEWYDPISLKEQWGKTIDLKPATPAKK